MPEKRKIQFAWKRRPSEIRGYERALYTTLDNGDYVRIDYNTGEQRARLYVEVAEEDGASYYSIISHGKITLERNSSGRSARVAERFKERSDEFATIPNDDVISLINNNYGIRSSRSADNSEKDQQRQNEIAETRRKYFRQSEVNPYSSAAGQETAKSRIELIDFIDLSIGILVGGIFFLIYGYNFMALGAAFAFWGMLLGVFDILLREREPVFLKIFIFLGTGTLFYIYGYFYA